MSYTLNFSLLLCLRLELNGEWILITVLAGGVGAARFLTGLKHVIKDEISVIVNTGDDIELYGLHISPDLDIITYTLSERVNEDKGWGIRDDTFHFLNALKDYGSDAWFCLGDKDLATHIYRTELLRRGFSLSQATNKICKCLGVKVKVLPMTNDKFETRIITPEGEMHFEEYFVKRQFKDKVLGVGFIGAKTAEPAPGVLDAILEAEKVVVCPSNPIVSIGTILSVNQIREALNRTKAKVVAVSPIVAGAPIKGPADKMLQASGIEVSAYGVAKLYSDFLDEIIIDNKDEAEKERIEKLGINVTVTNTIMKTFEDKVLLAKAVLEI